MGRRRSAPREVEIARHVAVGKTNAGSTGWSVPQRKQTGER
jgi:hypothetical protein